MKIRFFLMLFLGLISFLSYSQNPMKRSLVDIDVNPNRNIAGELKLSDFAESIEYIPLETKDKCLMTNIRRYDISDNYIVAVCGKTEIVYLFRRNGRFISQLGATGGGPGEYLGGPSAVFIDEQKKHIMIVTQYQRKLVIYGLNGKFLREEEISGNDIGFYRLFHKDHFYIDSRNYNGNYPFVYEIRTRDFKLVSEDIRSIPFEKRGNIWTGIGFNSKYIYENKVHTKESSLNDTIYVIDDDFSYKPKYVVNAGKYEITPELRGESDGVRYMKRLEEHVQFKSFFETDNYLLLSYLYEREKLYYAYYDKNKQKLLYFPSETGIVNDYDGGIDFWPRMQNNKTWSAFYEAHLFEDELSEKKKINPKGSAKAQQTFNSFIKSLDPDDNPVLIIVKLK